MKLKNIIIAGTIGLGLVIPNMAVAQVRPKPAPKPPKENAGDNGDAKEGVKGKPTKIDRGKVLERFKNARKNRADKHKKAKKRVKRSARAGKLLESSFVRMRQSRH